jgi:hypothetical protein
MQSRAVRKEVRDMTDTSRQTAKAVAAVQAVLAQGGDPKVYRQGLADHAGVTVEEIDAIIAQSGEPSTDSAAVIADRRLSDERRYARTDRAAYRAHQHEEE